MCSRLIGVCGLGLAALTLVLGTPAHVLAAGTVTAPEIDGGSLATGVGLVAASVLILRSRWQSK
jgi:hypothetical protein